MAAALKHISLAPLLCSFWRSTFRKLQEAGKQPKVSSCFWALAVCTVAFRAFHCVDPFPGESVLSSTCGCTCPPPPWSHRQELADIAQLRVVLQPRAAGGSGSDGAPVPLDYG